MYWNEKTSDLFEVVHVSSLQTNVVYGGRGGGGGGLGEGIYVNDAKCTTG